MQKYVGIDKDFTDSISKKKLGRETAESENFEQENPKDLRGESPNSERSSEDWQGAPRRMDTKTA